MRPHFRLLLVLLYGASGVTALAYEVLWMRPVGLLFGIGNFGVVVTVAAFMGGLGVGGLFGSRLALAAPLALKLFATIECAIALFALLLPTLLPVMDHQLLAVGGALSIGGWQALEAVAAFVLLLLPASAMGAAFPLVLTVARRCHVSVAAIYGANALGGVIGALLPLLLLPRVGWSAALHWVLLLGLLVGGGAFLMARALSDAAGEGVAVRSLPHPDWRDLAAYAGVGAAALMIEVAWVRMFGMVLLRTEYLLALILALMLVGIGGGSLLARHCRSRQWLARLPWLAAFGVVASVAAWPWLGQWAGQRRFASLAEAMVVEGGWLALLTLPTTLMLGAWLPLLARRLHAADDASHGTAAWLYGANSVGAALGAVVAGMVLMPLVGTPATLMVAALLLPLCALRWSGMTRPQWALFPLLLLLAAVWWRMPPAARLTPAVAGGVDLDRFEDAVNVTHVVQRPDGQRLLLADLQRMDAATDPTSVAVQKNQARLPLLLYPDAKRVLFLGLGTGITAAGSLPWRGLDRTAVELSPGAIAAAKRWFTPVNGDISAHARIIHDDVRRFLRRDRGRYDLIIGDLFHPDMAGRGALLSVEQFTRVRSRLAAGGLFVQWLAINQFDIANLAVVFATFHRVFPDGVLFIDGYRLALVARPGASLTIADRVPPGGDGGEGVLTWAARLWGAVPAVDAPLQSEWWPVIEYALPKVRYRDGDVMARTWVWLLGLRAGDMAAAALLHVDQSRLARFRRAREAALFNVRGWIAQLRGDGRAADRFARDAYRLNPHNRWASFAIADRLLAAVAANRLPKGMTREAALSQLLTIRPDHEQALRMMVALSRGDPARQEAWTRRLRRVAPLARLE